MTIFFSPNCLTVKSYRKKKVVILKEKRKIIHLREKVLGQPEKKMNFFKSFFLGTKSFLQILFKVVILMMMWC